MSTAAVERAIRENIGHGRHAAPGRPCHCGLPGWMPGVEHIPIAWSIKHGGGAQIALPSGQYPAWIEERIGKMKPVAVVDHIMVGWLSTMVDWALNRGGEIRKIIAHFGIGRAGRIVQFWPVNSPGIHVSSLISPTSKLALARASLPHGGNTYTVGKEHEGFSLPLLPDAQMTKILRDATWTVANPWPDAMLEASLRVDTWLYAEIPTLGTPSVDNMLGHYEFDARNRINDPAAATSREVWRRQVKLDLLIPKPVDLTPEQQEVVDFLRSPAGLTLSEQARRTALNGVGLTAMPPHPTATTPAAPSTHTVQPGDVLSVIASRYGIATADLAAWNGIANPNRIAVGQVLRLDPPSGAPEPPPPAPAPEPPAPAPEPPAPEPPAPAPEPPAPFDGSELTLLDEAIARLQDLRSLIEGGNR